MRDDRGGNGGEVESASCRSAVEPSRTTMVSGASVRSTVPGLKMTPYTKRLGSTSPINAALDVGLGHRLLSMACIYCLQQEEIGSLEGARTSTSTRLARP
jgi:hypothetical protein